MTYEASTLPFGGRPSLLKPAADDFLRETAAFRNLWLLPATIDISSVEEVDEYSRQIRQLVASKPATRSHSNLSLSTLTNAVGNYASATR